MNSWHESESQRLAARASWEPLLDAALEGRNLTDDELGWLDEDTVYVALRRGLVEEARGRDRLRDIADERWEVSSRE